MTVKWPRLSHHIAAAFGNCFYILLDFKSLESHIPFYQSALGEGLEYELTFNYYSREVRATGDDLATSKIENINLEFDMVSQRYLVRIICNQYTRHLPTPVWPHPPPQKN